MIRKGLFSLLSSSAGSQFISLLAAPILLRQYSPSQFGLYSFMTSMATIASVVMCGRLDMAIALAENSFQARRVLKAANLVSLLTATALAPLVAVSFILSDQGVIFLCALVSAIALAFFQAQCAFLLRAGKFGSVGNVRVINAALLAVVQIGIGMLFKMTRGMLLGYVVVAIGMVVVVQVYVIGFRMEFLSLVRLRVVARLYIGFLRYDIFSAFLNSFSSQVPVILFKLMFGDAVAGFYSVANRMLTLPVSVIGANVSQVFYQAAAERSRSGAEIGPMMRRWMIGLFVIGVLAFLPVLIRGEWLFIVLGGSKWAGSGSIAKLLIPWLFVHFVVSPFFVSFSVWGKLKTMLAFNVGLLGVRLSVVLCIYKLMPGDWRACVLGYSLVSSILYLGMIVPLFRHRELEKSKAQQCFN
ncbi:MAG: oligosaccharide flippase family protein [Fibrobacteres bacterium]|nr:oligosaccharide flippase family protein [Fibrobacterota bacterium]